MYLLQVSLLLCSSLYVHTSNILFPKLRQNNRRSENGLSDDKTNCFCYPEGPLPTIHDSLDPKNNGQERLVIYLYKNHGSNDIKMYTPKIEKQVLIPDIPYEAGDGLISVTTESIAILFYDNPHKIKVFNDHFESVNPSVIDSWPIGLNVGAVEIIYPNNGNDLTPNDANKENDFNIDQSINIDQYVSDNGYAVTNTEPINNISGIATQNTWPAPGEYDNESPEVIKQFWSSDKIKHTNGPSGNINPDIGPPKDFVFPFHTNGGVIALPSGSSTKDLNKPISNQYVTFPIWFNQQMKIFQNIQLPNDIKISEFNSLRILVQQTLAENNIHVSGNGVMTDSKGKVIDAADLELRPMLLGEKIEHPVFQKSRNKITLPKSVTYLEGILVTLVNPPQVLGIIPLGKTYLPQISFLGNIVNKSKSYRKDYGNINTASYSSVSKEPITIKDAYSGAVTGTPYVNSGADTGTPYVYSSDNGGLISSNIYSNVYTELLSPSYSYSRTNKVPHTSVSEASYWSSGPYSTVSEEPVKSTPLPNARLFGKRRKVSDAKIEHHYESIITRPIKKKGKRRLYGKSKNHADAKVDELKENITPLTLKNVDSSGSGRRFETPSLKRIVKTLLYILNDAPTGRNAGSGGIYNSTDTEDIVNGSESLNGGNHPDFRIIGGNAATGSGTPLSNKGRSGYEEYI